MKKISSNFIFTAVIGLIFLLLIGLNWNNYLSVFKKVIDSSVQDGTKINLEESISNTLKADFTLRDDLIDLCGFSKRLLGERIIGDNEYAADEIGMLQYIVSPIKGDNYISSMEKMSKLFKERNIPCVNVNFPDRGEKFSPSEELSYAGKIYHEIEMQLDHLDVDRFNVKEELVDTSIVSFEDFYFKTDVHATTKAEFYIAKQLTKYLADNYLLNFPDTDNVYNEKMYDWKSYDFLGNLGDSCGRFFVGTDSFQTFIPKFNTNLKLTVPGEKIIEGDFNEVMTNGYNEGYWITNYGQWPQALYQYDNLNYPDAPRLLVICDSIFMRANVFLTLNASHVTVFDPRYIEGNEYIIDYLLEDKYDAVIVCSSEYFRDILFADAPVIPGNVSVPWDGYMGMCLDYVNNNHIESDEISKVWLENNEFVSANGWAADFSVNQPLSKLYLKLGDHIIKCKYGLERTSVSDYFGIESIKNCGFEVKFPKDWLDGVNTLEFIQIGQDGTYRFETVSYKIVD